MTVDKADSLKDMYVCVVFVTRDSRAHDKSTDTDRGTN